MSTEKIAELLASYQQQISREENPLILGQTYHQLRTAFAHWLFDGHHGPPDHYAWLLMNQDAGAALEKLVVAHQTWRLNAQKAALWQTYQRALADFRWIVTMALACMP